MARTRRRRRRAPARPLRARWRDRVARRCRSKPHACCVSARRPGPHRRQEGLRRRRLRHMHGRRRRARRRAACASAPSTPASSSLPTLDGKELITVESLQSADGTLHPVQRALVDCHGSQCGFCTPGFVMSLFALYKIGAEAVAPRDQRRACRATCAAAPATGRSSTPRVGCTNTATPRQPHEHWMSCSFVADRRATASTSERG